MQKSYETFMLSEEPKIAGIPIVSGLPCISLTVIGLILNCGFQLFVIGGFLSFILHVKFSGDGIRFFYSIIYWMLPNYITKYLFGLRRSPNSAYRVYLR
ncbi:type IV conjugative transfer system protein TraL [Thiotrichales bacterium 19S11-10]|nr:type IV conjugative transfer system protein TraL [Thiotrichales bacterium 19S11-10]